MLPGDELPVAGRSADGFQAGERLDAQGDELRRLVFLGHHRLRDLFGFRHEIVSGEGAVEDEQDHLLLKRRGSGGFPGRRFRPGRDDLEFLPMEVEDRSTFRPLTSSSKSSAFKPTAGEPSLFMA